MANMVVVFNGTNEEVGWFVGGCVWGDEVVGKASMCVISGYWDEVNLCNAWRVTDYYYQNL